MKNKRVWIVLVGILLVVAVGLFFIIQNKMKKNGDLPADGWSDPVLEAGGYEAVLATMDGELYFSEQEFLEYRGLNVVKTSKRLETLAHIQQLTELVCEKSENLNTVYLQINPMQLYKGIELGEQWQEMLEIYMVTPIEENERVTYEILLSYPKLSYLAALTEEEWRVFKQVYLEFVESLSGLENVFVYYLGDKEWLNRNPLNYENDFQVNRLVEKNIILSTFCDRKYVVTPAQMQILMSELDELLGFYRVKEYPDFSDWSFVFLGDSIIGNDRSTCAVPDVVAAFSGANAYNCGKNGAAVTYDEEAEISFLEMIQALISADTADVENADLASAIDLFHQEYDNGKLCFVLNFGLNDYFTGYPVENPKDPLDKETFAGALRTGIRQLKEAYPEACVVVMLPTYTILFGEGTQIMSDEGDMLAKYREVARAIAEEESVWCKDNFADMPLDINTHTTLLVDGTHLNEWGRYVMGNQFITFFEKNVLSTMEK